MHEGVIEMIKNLLLIGSLTAVAALSGIFDVGTVKTLAAVVLGSAVLSAGLVLNLENRKDDKNEEI